MTVPNPNPAFAVLEDHPIVRAALIERLLGQYPSANIVYEGKSISQAIAAIKVHPVDCVILDLDLGDNRPPIQNTLDLIDCGSPILIISALADPAVVRSSLIAGALGYVSKNANQEDFLECVGATLRGEQSISRDLAAILYNDTLSVALSAREREAMVLYASGLKLEAVARKMNVQPGTASEYIKRVREKYTKAGKPVSTKTDLYKQAVQEGLLP
ncbi:MAG: response regulator transcription factor [Actinobacteria bacterium]|nr:response regulator transcription factor [Actinomycetota bacterium]